MLTFGLRVIPCSKQDTEILKLENGVFVKRFGRVNVNIAMVLLGWCFDRGVCVSEMLSQDCEDVGFQVEVDLRRHARSRDPLSCEHIATHLKGSGCGQVRESFPQYLPGLKSTTESEPNVSR